MLARRSALAILVFVAAAILPVVSAPAATSYKTKIVVSIKFPAFHGTLQSPRGSCIANRTVKLFREKSGPDKQLGWDKSDSNGNWSIPIGNRLISGGYYEKAPARDECKAAKSKVTYVD